MTQGLIILLNGVSSSGKTTIAGELVSRLESFFHFSIDDYASYIEKMENRKVKKIIHIHTEYLFHKTVQIFSDHNVNIVVDHILHDEFTKQHWFELLGNYPVLYVGVRCEPEDLDKREQARADRYPGQGKSQLSFTHENMSYDVEVNTSRQDTACSASLIIEALRMKFKDRLI